MNAASSTSPSGDGTQHRLSALPAAEPRGEGLDSPSVAPILAPKASRRFNLRLWQELRELARDLNASIGGNLVALVLGGGYGRGEGAVVRPSGQELPYNDVDLTVVVAHRQVRQRAFIRIKDRYEPRLGIEVDFSRPLTVGDIERWPAWLMWHDLLLEHKVVQGREDILTKHAPQRVRLPPPSTEAIRLLLNRGAGLLWAMRVGAGHEPSPDEDFVRRNYHKLMLALGDALLICHTRFHPMVIERQELFDELLIDFPGLGDLLTARQYAESCGFKLDPQRVAPRNPGREALLEAAKRWLHVLLFIEGKRTGTPFRTREAYARWKGDREPHENVVKQWPRNLVRNAQQGVFSSRGPRERLFRTLPLLLDPDHVSSSTWPRQSAVFLRSWQHVN